MPRKNSAAAVAAAPPIAANDATSAPTTVVARKRARRKVASPSPAVVVSRPEIDPRDLGAKEKIVAAYPHVTIETMRESDAAAERAALGYLEARDAIARGEGVKEACANVLRIAIGEHEGLIGDGWQATWKEQKAGIDWAAYVKAERIDSATLEKYRKPDHRVLLVKETADGGSPK